MNSFHQLDLYLTLIFFINVTCRESLLVSDVV